MIRTICPTVAYCQEWVCAHSIPSAIRNPCCVPPPIHATPLPSTPLKQFILACCLEVCFHISEDPDLRLNLDKFDRARSWPDGSLGARSSGNTMCLANIWPLNACFFGHRTYHVGMEKKRTMTLNLSESDMHRLDQMAAAKDLPKTAVIRQALRLYHLVDARLAAGERMVFEGDQDKAELVVI